MPTEQAMKAAMQAYIDTFNGGDAAAVAALYADWATVEDPVGSPVKHGRAEMRRSTPIRSPPARSWRSMHLSVARTATAPPWPSVPASAPSPCV